jgi:hypothetical protein
MKKSLLFIATTLVSFTTIVAQRTSNLVIFAEDATPFFAVVNGIRQNIDPQTNVKITGLTNNANTVRVIFSNTAIPALSQNIYFQDMGVEATIKITNTKKGYKLRYFGEVPLETAPVDNTQWVSTFQVSEPTVNTIVNSNNNATVVTTTVVEEVVTTSNVGTGNVNMNTNVGANGFGNTTTTTTTGTNENMNFNTNVSVNDGAGMNTNVGMYTNVNSTSSNSGKGESVNIGVNMGGVGFNMNVNVTETGMDVGQNVQYNESVSSTTSTNTSGFGNTATTSNTTTTTTTTTTITNSTTGGGFDNWNTGTSQGTTPSQVQYVEGYTGFVGCAVPQSKVDNIKNAIDNESFSSNKMQVAKQATKNKCLTTAQVIEIAEMFSFEDDKLEYVKYAYDYTYDRDNYYQVNSIFSFSATKDKLNAFLSTK